MVELLEGFPFLGELTPSGGRRTERDGKDFDRDRSLELDVDSPPDTTLRRVIAELGFDRQWSKAAARHTGRIAKRRFFGSPAL